MSGRIHKLTMPKWGLSMTEGRLAAWLVDSGTPVSPGAPVAEVETEKISSELEAPTAGVFRQAAELGEMIPVKGLVGVIADPSVPASEIDAFVDEFRSKFVPKKTDEEPAGPEPETIDVAGRGLRYLRLGDEGDESDAGEPAILIHGFGGDLNNWLFNHEALAADRAVYAVDLPGHGGSSKQVGQGSLDEFTDTIEAFLDALDIPKAHFVGHSIGGAVALNFGLTRPDRTLSLALIAPAGLGPEINADYIEGFISAAKRRDLKPHLEKLFADASLVSRQLIDDVLKYKRIDGVEAALRTIAGSLFADGRQTAALRDRLEQLTVPTLVLWGEEDQILPAAHARGLPAKVQTQTIPGRGHMLQMEAADQVNRALADLWG